MSGAGGLAALIRRRIEADGPMPLSDFMALCLSHPEHGYYMRGDPLGRGGDFTTAPEISQMFGEMIGLWARAVADAAGLGPAPRLVELGPGRGTLMADALRALPRGAEVWFVEISPALRARQAARVPGARHAIRIDEIPPGPAIWIANEFFDALPARGYLRHGARWRERLVGLTAEGGLRFGLGTPLPAVDAPDGADWAEVQPAARAVAAAIAGRIATEGGALVAIDYGYTATDRPAGPTLQAIRAHASADPLADPGAADLTVLVDFDALAATLAGAGLAVGISPQGAFLARLGIGARAAALARRHPAEADAIADQLERLTGPAAMGRLFKALAAWPPGQPPPPGFEEPR